MHNIAVLMNGKGDYAYCPIFDNGAGLLADTTMDCPLTGNIYILMDKDRPKTICSAFDEQLDISESLYKINLKFCFTKRCDGIACKCRRISGRDKTTCGNDYICTNEKISVFVFENIEDYNKWRHITKER